jgi:predicted outer membrane protein
MIRPNEAAMRKLLLLALAVPDLLFCVDGALAQANLQPDTTLRLPSPPGTGLSADNKAFIDQALAAASATVEAGQLASRQAKNDAVRALAGDMASDQQKVKDSLTRLSESKGYKPGTPAAPAEVTPLARLSGASGSAEFDRTYLTAQNQATYWLTSVYQTEMAQTQDVQLRTFAAEQALMLRKHLDGMQKAAGAIGLKLEAPKSAPQY